MAKRSSPTSSGTGNSRTQTARRNTRVESSSTGAVVISVPSFAKLNLDLRVLHRRPDGYHDLRTVFQTIDLHDTLRIEFRKSRQVDLDLESSVEIEDNIVLRAARAVLEYLDISASVRFSLKKVIPMGAGLGGGSSNAAAVLMALPALAGKRLSTTELQRLASWLGSDVPFFLYGGTALGLDRGTELYPLPELPAYAGIVVAPGIHVSTAEAYRDLQRPLQPVPQASNGADSLTSEEAYPMLREFQAVAWSLASRPLSEISLHNDFESVVLSKHPKLAQLARKLKLSGANPALMTGSGSAFFGLYESPSKAKAAATSIRGAMPIKLLTRQEYRKKWVSALGPHAELSTFGQA